ncbi:hypothetical protein L3X38_010975 [Prunus dulcis]|uniref:Retrotransposon Copia-like N-terminal domain-containing protein n=1 Tax=Prunus dulcis TaxID=3755 RepID=A0AAD4WI60_PRUDU|nr:hypothetical protein L3X38_010975 [Prunus dulcis]
MASSNVPTISNPNISHLVSIKLSDTNYLVWESQVKPFLLGQNLRRFVDGSHPCPSPTLSPSDKSESSTLLSVNLDYVTWFQTDQSLISILRVTLSESVLPQVIGFSTSKEIWDCLQQNFSQQSLANSAQLKFRLFSLTKGSKSIFEYLAQAKSLADELTAIQEPVSNSDLVTYVLRGLGLDYQMIVTAILNFPPLPSFSNLRTRLLAFEGQQALVAQMAPVASPTTFVAARFHRGPCHCARVTNPLVLLVVCLQSVFSLARASIFIVLRVIPCLLKVFWVLHFLASQFNVGIAINLAMFKPSALLLVLSLACILHPLQTRTGIWIPVPPIT